MVTGLRMRLNCRGMALITTIETIECERGGLADVSQESFAAMFESHRMQLSRMVNARLGKRLARRVDADDVVQDVYLNAYSRIRHFERRNANSFLIWLKLVADQTVTDTLRRHRAQKRDASRDVPLESPLLASERSFGNELAMQGLEQQEMLDKLQQIIKGLRESDRQIIYLRHRDELQNKEIAARLGITQKAASIRYARALKRLKDEVAEVTASE